MPTELFVGQRWAAWIPGRRQWLLTTLVRFDKGRAILKFDSGYGVQTGQDEYAAERSQHAEHAQSFPACRTRRLTG